MRNIILYSLFICALLLCNKVNANVQEEQQTNDDQEEQQTNDVQVSKENLLKHEINKLGQELSITKKTNDEFLKKIAKLESENSNHKNTIKELEANVRSLEVQKINLSNIINSAQANVIQLKKEKDDLEARVSEIRNKYSVENTILEKDKDQYKAKYEYYRRAYKVVSIILFLIIGICIFIVLFRVIHSLFKHFSIEKHKFIIQDNTSKQFEKDKISNIKNSENELRCPLCGWKYTPGQKICKNCKTQF